MPRSILSRVNAVTPIARSQSGSNQMKQGSQSQPTPNKKPSGGSSADGKSFGDYLQKAMSNMKPRS